MLRHAPISSLSVLSVLLLCLSAASAAAAAAHDDSTHDSTHSTTPSTAARLVFGNDTSVFLPSFITGLLAPLSFAEPLTFSFGDTPLSRSLVSPAELRALPAGDAFLVRIRRVASADANAGPGGAVVAVCVSRTALGVSYAAAHLLKTALGFGWLHPMRQIRPSVTSVTATAILATAARTVTPTPPGPPHHITGGVPSVTGEMAVTPFDPTPRDVRRAPAYPVRGSHVHAEHPNELCNVLNGFDAVGGHMDAGAWASLLPEVRRGPRRDTGSEPAWPCVFVCVCVCALTWYQRHTKSTRVTQNR